MPATDEDRVFLDGIELPGVVQQLKVTPSRDTKKEKGPGLDGPRIKDQGYEGASVDLTLRHLRYDERQRFFGLIAALSPRQQGAISKPHTIEHPVCAAFNVTRVYIAQIECDVWKAKGPNTVAIKMHEWFPAPKKTKQGGVAAKKKKMGDGGPIADGHVGTPKPQTLGAQHP